MHDEDDVIAYDNAGEPVTRRSLREAHERHHAQAEEFVVSMRRLLAEELTLDQLGTVQQLFTDLARPKNPRSYVLWWEGQIDALVWARDRAEATAPPIPEGLHPVTEAAPPQPETADVESAVVEGTLDRHTFDGGEYPGRGESSTCLFAVSNPLDPSRSYVCGLSVDAPPHQGQP